MDFLLQPLELLDQTRTLSLLVSGSSVDTLQELMLMVVDHEICSQGDWWGSQAKVTLICAGGDGMRSGCSVKICYNQSIFKLLYYSFLPI